MLSYSPIERAKPLLGTTVSIRLSGLGPVQAHGAIDAAFAEVAQIHALMSFHDDCSDVSRLNRDAHIVPIAVDERTYRVIARALAISEISDGAFDISVAPALVTRGLLPRPRQAPVPDAQASWRDIELQPDLKIRFRKPLWIDLGGIAKGFAVDRATAILSKQSPCLTTVNAGGDLRVAGGCETIRLAAPQGDGVPVVQLTDGSLASSCGRMLGRRVAMPGAQPHVEARQRLRALPEQFVSVTAPLCIDADALTKVVMAKGVRARLALIACNARAVVHDALFGWRELGSA